MSLPPLPIDEREALAGEYALGVLAQDELQEARARFADDPAFRTEVHFWWGRLAPLLDSIDHREPPARVWGAIEQRLGGTERGGATIHHLRTRLNVWRGLAVGASALAASLALVLVSRPQIRTPIEAPAPRAPAAPMVAMLGDAQEGTKLMATWDAGDRRLVLAAAAELAADPGHVHELWVIPADGTPRSLGTIPASPRMNIAVSEQLSSQLQSGATLAVSVEPTGGSPTGLPTGAVIASGKLERA